MEYWRCAGHPLIIPPFQYSIIPILFVSDPLAHEVQIGALVSEIHLDSLDPGDAAVVPAVAQQVPAFRA